MILKTYTYVDHNLSKLHKEVNTSGHVSNFAGINGGEGTFSIIGDTLLNEAGLDALVAAHNPVGVPEEITPRQGRQALFLAGIPEANVLAALNALEDPTKTLSLIEWEYSTAFVRSNPLINNMGAALGLTPTQVDELFILGATL